MTKSTRSALGPQGSALSGSGTPSLYAPFPRGHRVRMDGGLTLTGLALLRLGLPPSFLVVELRQGGNSFRRADWASSPLWTQARLSLWALSVEGATLASTERDSAVLEEGGSGRGRLLRICGHRPHAWSTTQAKKRGFTP